MKKRMLAVLLSMTVLLTACQAGAGESVATQGNSVGGKDTDAAKEQETKRGKGELTVADIKLKYAAESNADEEETQDIMPLYNVAEDQTFDFTFQADLYDFTESDLVTVHTDSECNMESEVAVYTEEIELDSGFKLSISPVAPILETLSNEEEYAETEKGEWGNAPVYYIAIWYDTEAKTPEKLKEPIIIPFTVKHDVQAPEVYGLVDANGCFYLQWEPVEGAEEYRVYNLVDGQQWTGSYNEPVNGAKSGYYECSLMYMDSTTDTTFADFNGSGENSVVPYERSTSGRIYYIGQNFSVGGEYYVSAVVDGVESGFASAVTTCNLKIPYVIADEYDIMFETFEDPSDLPLKMDVINIDGSVNSRNVFYTYQDEETWIEGAAAPEYAYCVEGTILSGCVSMDNSAEREYPETIGTMSPTGNSEPENDIKKQPDADIETIIGEGENGEAAADLYQKQKENTKKHQENAKNHTTKAVDEKYLIFADNAEEEWLAMNLINGETEISLEGFPKLQYAETLEDEFYKVYYQNPYILGVTRFGYSYKNMTFYVEYAYSQEEMQQMQKEIYEEAEHIINEIITEDMDEEAKRLAIYQYLEKVCDYDYAALENAEKNDYKKTGSDEFEYAFNTYGIIVKKEGVCQSFAYAYKLLCSMCGVECNVMTGFLDGSLPHAWNTVKIEDKWYQTDITNNGKITNIPYFLYNSDSETAQMTGYSEDDLYEMDERLSDYESIGKDYEYYYANSLYAQDLDEYKEVLDALLAEENDTICVRYEGEQPEQSEFEDAVVEVFSRRNMENRLAVMGYGIRNDFIILTEK